MSEIVFKQSITRMGSILRPDILIVTDTAVKWKKRNKNLINYDTKSFDIDKITSVEIDSSLYGTTIIIRTIAGDKVEVERFTLDDAKEFKKVVTKRQESMKTGAGNIAATNRGSVADELYKLKQLLDEGIITPSEFKKMKKRLLK